MRPSNTQLTSSTSTLVSNRKLSPITDTNTWQQKFVWFCQISGLHLLASVGVGQRLVLPTEHVVIVGSWNA